MQPKNSGINWLRRLGLGAKAKTAPCTVELNSRDTLSTSQVDVTKLMEAAHCQIALIDTAGVMLKLHYVPAANSAAAFAPKLKSLVEVA
jgi:hypothetical protein